MKWTALWIAALALATATSAFADKSGPINDPTNEPPPAGTIIDQLTGLTISGTYATRTPTFIAGSTTTNLAFAFREDPAFIDLGNVSLVDLTTASGNLLVNGDFGLGPVGSSAPTGWAYLNTFGASFGGVLDAGCGPGATGTNPGNNCYDDGAVQAYDAINQLVGTTIGDLYQVSYTFRDTCGAGACGTAGGVTVYQPISTNGDVSDTLGNGRDMFVYAGASVITASTPEPSSLLMFGSGLLALGGIVRRRLSL